VSGEAGPDAVVFDLDGVLVDSEPAWDAARRAVVAEAGGHWREGATRAMIGMSSPEWSRYLHEELGAQLEPAEINERVVARLLAEYQANGVALLPGAADAVRELAARWPLGLASSANTDASAEADGQAHDVESLSAAVVSAERSPTASRRAMSTWRQPPARRRAVAGGRGRGLEQRQHARAPRPDSR
jgi:beta-phosphoglucomutase-like phosphatase (HAD superfamily)